MASKRMTANPVKPARYRPGKAVAEEASSSEDEDEDEDGSEEGEQQRQETHAPPPKALSFPSDATKIASNLRSVDLSERRKQAATQEAARLEEEKALRAAEEEGFVTEESEEEEGSDDDSGSGSESGSEESSSEDEAPRKLLRPNFIKKDKREATIAVEIVNDDQKWAEEEARRKEKADAMIQEQLEKDAAARAAGRKDWDDDDVQEVDFVDDTDDVDPATERAAWKLRELKRIKRERDAIETAEKEREEIERRRNLNKEDRETEDKEFLDAQKEERDGKGKMGYMQKYFHKGAFFQDDAKAEGLDRRDIMGSRFEDATNRELLPQYMQVRDMTKLGRKSGTKYKDLMSEDTGKWGVFDDRGPRKPGNVDERFMPDKHFGGKEVSGANTTKVGQRRIAPDAPEGAPAGSRHAAPPRNEVDKQQRDSRPRSYSRSRSPPRRRQRSRSRSPPHRRDRRRERSYSYSRSPSPRRDWYRDEPHRRKRSSSPYHDLNRSDKRRRIDA